MSQFCCGKFDDLYRSYKDWGTRRNEFVMIATAFGLALTEHGFEGDRDADRKHLRFGICLGVDDGAPDDRKAGFPGIPREEVL